MNICVTGASKGLGRELCKELLKAGHSVWGVARSRAAEFCGSESPGELNRFHYTQCDVADSVSIGRWMQEMQQAKFHPDVIILNAAIQHNDLGSTFDAAAAAETINVNLAGSLHCISAFLPQLQARKHGQIIAITSTIKWRPSRRSAGYAASKAGLSMAMRSLRLKYGTKALRFREVCFGPLQTSMWEGKQSLLIPSPDKAAARVASFLTGNRDTLCYPFLSTWLLRLSHWLPDSLFTAISNHLLLK